MQARLRGLRRRLSGRWSRTLSHTRGRTEGSFLVALGALVAAGIVVALALRAGPALPSFAQGNEQFARPIADVATGGWGITPLWDKLDEVAPDDATTEIQSSNDPINDPFEVQLSAVTDPGVSTGHLLRYRVAQAGTKTATVDAALYQGLTLIATDMIRLAWEDAYDVAVLATSDSDLVPAVQFLNLKGLKVVQAGFPPVGVDLATKCWGSFDVYQDRKQVLRS